MKRIILTTAAIFAMPLAVMAQVTPAPTGPTSVGPAGGAAKLSMQDTHFIKVAGIAGISEVSDGNLAKSKGDATVKKLGTMMVMDHTKANDQLMSLASAKGVTAPGQVDAKHAAISAELNKLSGASFDHKYLSTELTGHEMTIAAFKTEVADGSDPDLKSFASATLPILEHHLAMIEAARK